MKSKSGHKRSSSFQDSRKEIKKKTKIAPEKNKSLNSLTEQQLTKKAQLNPKHSVTEKKVSHIPKYKVPNNATAQIRSTDAGYSSKQRALDRKELFMQRKRDQASHPKKTEEVWFEGVDPALIAASQEDQAITPKTLVKDHSFDGLTRRVAMDCEFVGIGFEGKENALARVSIVNQFGQILLDKYVRVDEKVMDYRTQFSGIRAEDLIRSKARPYMEVQKEVAQIIDKRFLIGHSIHNDLKVLLLSHPRRLIRDTSKYKPFRALTNGRTPALRELTRRLLGIQVQAGEHCSVEDARATMRLYMGVKTIWEASLKKRVAGRPDEAPDSKMSVNQDGTSGESKRQKFLRQQMRRRNRRKAKSLS